jgi:hypothetical protein
VDVNLLIGIKMTAFNASTDLPTGAGRTITTIEQLNAWSAEILLINNATAKYVRKAGDTAENRIQVSTGVDADNTQRVQTLCIFEYDLAAIGTAAADWTRVKEVGSAPIPASMKG